MAEWSQIRAVLNEIKQLDHVIDVSLISRGGMYVMGDPPSGAHQETFAAMSAIILGAAETTSAELKETLRNVIIGLGGRNLVLTEAGSKYMLAIAVDGDGNIPEIVREARQRVSGLEIRI